MIRPGGHGPPAGSGDPAAFARAHREFGYGPAAYAVALHRLFAAGDAIGVRFHHRATVAA